MSANNLLSMLADKIKEDFLVAFKARESLKKEVLSGLKSAIKYVEIDKKIESLDDEGVIDVISKEVKKRKDSIEQFEAADRQDLADKEKAELEILNVYMPEQMSEEEIEKIVDEVIGETGASSKADTGKLMGALMPKLKGKADGSIVKKIVDSKLS